MALPMEAESQVYSSLEFSSAVPTWAVLTGSTRASVPGRPYFLRNLKHVVLLSQPISPNISVSPMLLDRAFESQSEPPQESCQNVYLNRVITTQLRVTGGWGAWEH